MRVAFRDDRAAGGRVTAARFRPALDVMDWMHRRAASVECRKPPSQAAPSRTPSARHAVVSLLGSGPSHVFGSGYGNPSAYELLFAAMAMPSASWRAQSLRQETRGWGAMASGCPVHGIRQPPPGSMSAFSLGQTCDPAQRRPAAPPRRGDTKLPGPRDGGWVYTEPALEQQSRNCGS